ncbi:uncharacterized protein LOC128236510 isoform X2 [Mya arenaria]|uniref:uncharacterized protein LOC128236510 isoform X2 n=1 Tax=Mya arenaria TaxID=6604 RepID=UPI0022DF697F|nr:uncharacterized protein LOC128236510 isoform X2 [Mya arenaria]
MFKKKIKHKKSDNIDSIKIPWEKESKYAVIANILEPDIIRRLEPKQVLPYMPSIDPTCSEKIKKIGEIDRTVASRLLLDAIKKSPDRGIWREFMTALERTKYIALRLKLHGDQIHDDALERRYIEIMTPQLRQIINPCEITPGLLSVDVLIQEDIEDINCEANNRGSIAATDLLLKRVSGKHPSWYSEFVTALFKSGMSNAGKLLLEGVMQGPVKSKYSKSLLTQTTDIKQGEMETHPLSESGKERISTSGSSRMKQRPSAPSLTTAGELPSEYGNSKKQQRPHSSVSKLTISDKQPNTHENYYLTRTVQTRECEEYAYDEVQDDESSEDREDIPDTEDKYYLTPIVQKRECEEYANDEVPGEKKPENTEDNPVTANSNYAYLGMNGNLYESLLPEVPPRVPRRISKEIAVSMPIQKGTENKVPDTDLNVEKETMYVYSVENNETISHRSFQKGEMIRVIKPKYGEEDEEYYRSADEEGQLIPKICVEVIEVTKRKSQSTRTSTSLDVGSTSTDTQTPENMLMMLNDVLSYLLKKHTVDHKLEQQENVLKEQSDQRKESMMEHLPIPEDDDEDDLENVTSLC